MGNQAGKDRTPGGGKDDYETDDDFYTICNYEFRFGLDAAASKYNHKLSNYFNKEDNSLEQSWFIASNGRSTWLNPPYSRGMVPAFLEKSWEESQVGLTVAVLVHTTTDTKYWDDWVWDKAAEVRHMKGRLPFWSQEPDKKGRYGNTSDLPHSLIIYRPFYDGPTFQSSWDWKASYIKRFGFIPVRDKKSKKREIKYYLDKDKNKVYRELVEGHSVFLAKNCGGIEVAFC